MKQSIKRLAGIFIAALFIVCTISIAQAQQPPWAQTREFVIRFYEGNGASQDYLCGYRLQYVPGAYSSWGPFVLAGPYNNYSRCPNDEIRSLSLENAPAGLQIDIYDSSYCDERDDHTVVWTGAGFSGAIYSFERFYAEQASVRGEFSIGVSPQSTGNLDGKVSCIKISYNP